jgi:pre-rRNA-processing protein TSR1
MCVIIKCNVISGRTSAKTFTKKARHELSKGERKNKAAQIRQKKREEILLKKRSLGGATSAPLLIAVIALCDDVDSTGAVRLLEDADEEAVITRSREGYVHIR